MTVMKMMKLMIAETNDPKFRNVVLLPAWPSCTPRPIDFPPWNLAMIGLMMEVVNALMRPLNARATTSPTAVTMTSPRIRKFLKPFIFFSPIPLRMCAGALTNGTGHTIPVGVGRRKRFRRVGCGLTCGSVHRGSRGRLHLSRVPRAAGRRHRHGAEHLHEEAHRGRVGRVAVPDREHVPVRARQRHGPDPGMPRGAQAERGQGRDPQVGGHQRL